MSIEEEDMKLRDYAEKAAKNVFSALGQSPTANQNNKVAKAIEDALIQAVLETKTKCCDVAMAHSSEEKDLAHKISDQIEKETDVLIANLSSLR